MSLKQRRHSGSGAAGSGTTRGGSAGSLLTPKQREQQQRRQRALKMHLEGKTLQTIADELGWSGPSGASYALKMARRELREASPVEDLPMLRRLYLLRLEEMLSRVFPLALGGTNRNGEHIPPSLKHAREARRIMADMNKLMGLNVRPEEAAALVSQGMAQPGVGDYPGAVMVVDFDGPAYEEAMRRKARQASDERVFVDDQPPAGRIAPRLSDDATEPEEMVFEPNSVDIVRGQTIYDPRVAPKPK